jgi:hypothetical protein
VLLAHDEEQTTEQEDLDLTSQTEIAQADTPVQSVDDSASGSVSESTTADSQQTPSTPGLPTPTRKKISV